MPEVTVMLTKPILQRAAGTPGVAGGRRRDRRRTARAALAPLLAACFMLVLVLLPAAAARADHLDMTLGSGGQLYSVQAGLYGDLFGGQQQTAVKAPPAAAPVLALDTTSQGGKTSRQMVPASQDASLATSPALIYEDGSKTLFVVWVSQGINTAVKLTSYDGTTWSDPIVIISNQYATKTPPQLAVTRDSHLETDPASGQAVTHHRTVLHIVWSEDAPNGFYQAYYAPVIFEDGAWIGNVVTPTHLNDFDVVEQAPQPASTGTTPLVYTPAVQAGRDASTVVTGFASDVSGMLTTVEVDALPEELRILADSCAATVAGQGAQYFPSQLSVLADLIQNVLTANGGAFQPEVLQTLISGVRGEILAGAADVNTLAHKARGFIIDSGFKFSARGLRPFAPGGVVAPPKVVEVIAPGGPSHFLQFRVDSTRPWPTVGATGLQLLLAHTGMDVLAAWTSSTAPGAIVYTRTQPDGTWSSQQQLQLSSSLTQQQALQVLERRIY